MRRKSIINRFTVHRLLEKLRRKFKNLPFTSDVLKGELGDYSAQNAKIAALVDDGYLLRMKKGMYCLAPFYDRLRGFSRRERKGRKG